MSNAKRLFKKGFILLGSYDKMRGSLRAYTAPWTVAWDIPWSPDGELLEYICQENNLYLYHLTDDFGQPIFGNR